MLRSLIDVTVEKPCLKQQVNHCMKLPYLHKMLYSYKDYLKSDFSYFQKWKLSFFNLFALLLITVTVLSAPVDPTDPQIGDTILNNNNNNNFHNIKKRSPTFFLINNNNNNYRQTSWYFQKYQIGEVNGAQALQVNTTNILITKNQ